MKSFTVAGLYYESRSRQVRNSSKASDYSSTLPFLIPNLDVKTDIIIKEEAEK